MVLVPTNNALPPSKGGADVVRDARRTDTAIAVENRIAVIRADVAGEADGLVSHGSSAIVDRQGTVLIEAQPLRSDLIVHAIERPAEARHYDVK